MKLSRYFLYLYLLAKPYYLFASGGFQIADFFLILAFIMSLSSLSFSAKGRLKIKSTVNDNSYLLLFVFFAIGINAIYFADYGSSKFIMSSLYFIFNIFAVLTFFYATNDKVLSTIGAIFKFNLIAQLAIYILGFGRLYSASRYMGTFNDPNQFGYYVLVSYFFIFAIGHLLHKFNNTKQKDLPYLLITLTLIIVSTSTGMLLGITIFLIGRAVIELRDARKYIRKLSLVISMGIVLILIATNAFFISSSGRVNRSTTHFSNSPDNQQLQFMQKRLTEKVSKAEGSSDLSIWEDRGYDKIFKYPQYIIFGSGEGLYTRFTKAATVNEIHATLPSLLFYYGIIPFAFIIKWVYKNLRRADSRLIAIYMALFAESFTLLNQRQTLFWILISLSTYSYLRQRDARLSFKRS